MSKNKAPEPTLASYWMAPERDGGVGEPVACLASTYTFHASLFENELLPRFLGLRYDQTERESIFVLEREDRLATITAAVFVDSTQVDSGQTTGRWSQVPVAVRGGCQHSKVTLLVWERFVRVVVASANLTTSGYRKNREMAAAFDFFDGEDSSPRELLANVLDFLNDELLAYGLMPRATSARLAETIDGVRRRVRTWRSLPAAADKLPTVDFLPVLPPRSGRRARGVLEALVDVWGNRRATDISVMTPFTGDSPEAVRTTMKALFEIPRTRDARGFLIVGGRPSADDEERFVADLPIWFRDEWAKGWKTEPADVSVYVVPPHRDDEPKAVRHLHAKAILVQSDDRTLLLMGSSNFSPHGLGIGAYNIEANVCFLARQPDHVTSLEGALPVDWNNDFADDVTWPEDSPPGAEDGPSQTPLLPAVFAWATYHDRLGKLTVGLDRSQTFPQRWSIRLPGANLLLESESFEVRADMDRLDVTLGMEHRARRITCIVIDWIDFEGVKHEARLPTLVADDDELLAPEEFRALTCDGILDCLLSGRDPIEWGESQSRKTKSSANNVFDPLKAIDTSTFTLYRTRRLGRALAALSRRLLATLRTPTAIRHRLERDPIGPVMFARAMVRDVEVADDSARAATVFALAELMLSLAHVGQRIDGKGKLGLAPLFHNAVRTIDDLRQQYDLDERVTTGSLAAYVEDVRSKCALVLGRASEAPNAG